MSIAVDLKYLFDYKFGVKLVYAEYDEDEYMYQNNLNVEIAGCKIRYDLSKLTVSESADCNFDNVEITCYSKQYLLSDYDLKPIFKIVDENRGEITQIIKKLHECADKINLNYIDVDWLDYYQQHTLTNEQIEELSRDLYTESSSAQSARLTGYGRPDQIILLDAVIRMLDVHGCAIKKYTGQEPYADYEIFNTANELLGTVRMSRDFFDDVKQMIDYKIVCLKPNL